MTEHNAERLEKRAVLAVSGPDSRTFLQNLISNDVGRVTAQQTVWSALLTPQGKFLHEFFLVKDPGIGNLAPGGEESLLLDCDREGHDDLINRLRLYRLRAKVEVTPRDDLAVFALPGLSALEKLRLNSVPGQTRAEEGAILFTDPRLASLGARAILDPATAAQTLSRKGFSLVEDAGFLALRLSLGVPEGRDELLVDKDVLLDAGFDELNGIDWRKGCFIGQEVTARMKYRALVKKRLVPVDLGDTPAQAGDAILDSQDHEVGRLRKVARGKGLALLRLTALEDGTGSLYANDTQVTAKLPAWVRIASKT